MSKLRLELDSIRVETFSTSAEAGDDGTVLGFETVYLPMSCNPQNCTGASNCQTRCDQTCNLNQACYGGTDLDMGCSAACTGLGVECYTQDPMYFACTGGNPCTEIRGCTIGCTVGCTYDDACG